MLTAHYDDFVQGIRQGGWTGHYAFMPGGWGDIRNFDKLTPYVLGKAKTAKGKPLDLREGPGLGRYIPSGHFYATGNGNPNGGYTHAFNGATYSSYTAALNKLLAAHPGRLPLLTELSWFNVDKVVKEGLWAVGQPPLGASQVHGYNEIIADDVAAKRLLGAAPWRMVNGSDRLFAISTVDGEANIAKWAKKPWSSWISSTQRWVAAVQTL